MNRRNEPARHPRTDTAPRLAMIMASALCGCMAAAGDPADGPDDAFLETGSVAILDGSLDAIRALRVANRASVTELRDAARLTTAAAQHIVAWRNGIDQIAGTADDRTFYTLAALDAVPDVGPATLNRLVTYGQAHELIGSGLRVDALPPELRDPDTVGLITAIAADSSLSIDGDPNTLLPSEWERVALFAHHFTPSTAVRVARLRGYMFGSDVRRGPFIDLVTLNRTAFGEGEPSWALDALLLRTAADPRHTIGRIYAAELAAALADAAFAARTPGLAVLQQAFLAIWTANIEVSDPGDLPLPLARSRALLASRGVATFTGPYPADRPSPIDIAATPFAMPFPPGTEIQCMQGNNSMSADASHGPNQLRYALDLNAPMFTTIAASANGTAYIYDHARPGSFDNYGFGNILLIDLHNGYALLHAHLSSFAVANGQAVTAGQIVGASGITGAAGAEPHVHFEVVRLFRTPDPAHEEYHSDTPIAADGPFGSPEPFSLLTLDVTASDTVRAPLPSTAFTCGESGWLPGAAHIYRAP